MLIEIQAISPEIINKGDGVGERAVVPSRPQRR